MSCTIPGSQYDRPIDSLIQDSCEADKRIHWHPSLESAMATAVREDKPVFITFYALKNGRLDATEW